VAFELGIPLENIIANQLLFGTSGEYAGFDPTEPTSRSGGKAQEVQQIRQVWSNFVVFSITTFTSLFITYLDSFPLGTRL
jgi:hypothetical protein